jgi:CRP-like cAMP-binding protein
MSTTDHRRRPIANRLLAALPQEEYVGLLPALEIVSVAWRQVLYAPNEPMAYVYFPHEGVISLTVRMGGGKAVEVATIGAEGMLGLPVLFAAGHATTLALSEIPGAAARLPAERFLAAVPHSPALHARLHRYAHALLTQVTQVAACNALHALRERCARWLLMMHDQVGGAPFLLTQEFLSQTQGARRATINGISQAFQQDGIIRYSRGRMTILGRARLQAIACECYAIIRGEYDRLLG